MAVQSLCWPLYEIVNGVEYTVTVPVSKPKPVTEYLKLQKRFSGAAASQVEKLQAMVTGDYEQLLNR